MEVLVSVVIITTLGTLLFAGQSRSTHIARRAACLSNLRQVGSALSLYLGEHNNRYFTLDQVKNGSWIAMVAPYANDQEKIFRCPAAPFKPSLAQRTYRFNVTRGNGYSNFPDRPEYALLGKNIAAVNYPSRTVTVVDFPIAPTADPQTVKLPFTAAHNTLWWAQLDTAEAWHYGYHGQTMANFLFVDGHAEALSAPVPATIYDYAQE